MTIQVIKKYIRADDEVYGIGYDCFVGADAEGLLSMPDRKGVQLVIAQLTKTNPKAKRAHRGVFASDGTKHSR